MRDVVLIFKMYQTGRKKHRDLIAVCASKRVAVKLILSGLLDEKIITVSEIGAVRKFINLNEKTAGFPVNYELVFKPQNKFITL